MAQKRILVTFNRPPFGSLHYLEGLRACVGMASGSYKHTLSIVYLGDGVYYTSKNVARAEYLKHLDTIKNLAFKLHVELESLTERGISKDEVEPDFNIIPRDDVARLIAESDVTMNF